MTDSQAPQPLPASGAEMSGFEMEMTAELLGRYQQELIEIAAGVRADRAAHLREKWRPWSAASNPSLRRGLGVICVIAACVSPLGALLSFGDADWVGAAVWIGISLLFLAFSVLFAILPRVTNKLGTLTGRWADARQAARIPRMLEPAFRETPYKVRHEFDPARRTWRVRSQRTGEQTYCMSSEMVAFHGDVAWVLLKPGWIARPVLSAVVETTEQQRLLDEFLCGCGVRVVDQRQLDHHHEPQPT